MSKLFEKLKISFLSYTCQTHPAISSKFSLTFINILTLSFLAFTHASNLTLIFIILTFTLMPLGYFWTDLIVTMTIPWRLRFTVIYVV